MSYDNGKTWPVKKLLGEGGFAYSSLAMVEPESLGCFMRRTRSILKS